MGLYNINSGYGKVTQQTPYLGGGHIFVVARTAAAGRQAMQDCFKPDVEGKVRYATTIAAAVAQCTASRGDRVYVAPNHTETIAAATTMAIAGVAIFGLGVGVNRPTITFSTSTAASYVFGAANMQVDNLIFNANIASQIVMLDFSGFAGGSVTNCLFITAGTTKVPLITIKTSATSDDMVITGNQFMFSTAVTNTPTEAIRLVGSDRINISTNYFSGNFSTAVINNITTLATDVRIQGNVIENLNTVVTGGIALLSTTTGIVSGNTAYSASTDATYASNFIAGTGAVIVGNTITNALGASTASSSTAEATVVRATATLPQTAAANIFTVTGGPVKLLAIVGEVTTVIQTQTDATKLQMVDTASSTTTDLCATLDITAKAVGSFFNITGTLANAMVNVAGGTAISQAGSITLPIGALKLNCGASNTGSVRWYVRYQPLAPGAQMVAA